MRALTVGVLGFVIMFSLIVAMQPAAAPRSTLTPQQRLECFDIDPQTRERIRGIVLDAIDAALKERVMHVYDVWMRDDTDQPARATVGLRQAIDAYLRSRASTLKWDPKPC
jgi:hypothetical protein